MEQQILIPQVSKNDAVGFSKQWTRNGLAIALDDVSIDFALDFANIVLRNFVLQIAANANAAAQQAKAPEAPQNAAAVHGHSGLVVE